MHRDITSKLALAKIREIQELIDELNNTTVGNLSNRLSIVEQNQISLGQILNVNSVKLDTIATFLEIEFNSDGTLKEV